ncbi:MAG: YggT family protein [Deltaproteobacteria bacterium]|nr:YggT family protein [Candidatus Zymogenaceae bacterium]
MYVLGNLIHALAMVLNIAITVYIWIIIIRALLSWVNPDPYNPIVRFLSAVTDPVLSPIRRRMPYLGGLDISPIIVIVILYFLRLFLVPTLLRVAVDLGVTSFFGL